MELSLPQMVPMLDHFHRVETCYLFLEYCDFDVVVNIQILFLGGGFLLVLIINCTMRLYVCRIVYILITHVGVLLCQHIDYL